MKITIVVLLVILVVALLISISAVAMNGAQTGTARGFSSLLADLAASNRTVMLEFITPLNGQERTATVDAGALRLGLDYLCIAEPWNQGQRQTCTPMSNIASVTYVEE
jgi:hypothetical protein